MKNTLKTAFTSITASALLLSATVVPSLTSSIDIYSITASAASVTQKNISHTNSYGTWTFSVESDSNYSNATLTVTSFKPSNGKTEIRIPSSVTITFTDSSGNTHTLSNCKITKIANNAFSNSSITSVSISPYIEDIGDGAFKNAKQLKTVKFSSNTRMKKIKDHVFYMCKSLTNINIPDSVTEIGTGAFYECTSLETVNLPNSLITINNSAFSRCSKLSSVDFEACRQLSTIGGSAFSTTALTNVIFSSSLTSIEDCFYNCNNLETITVPAKQSVINQLPNNITNLNLIGDMNSISDFSAIRKFKYLSKINDECIIINDELNPKFHMIYKDAEYGDNDNIDKMIKSKIETIVRPLDDLSDFKKAKYIHDWICKKVYYDIDDKWNNDNHTDYSVFLNDNTVCNGYARAYALLMQAAGVETYYVTGNQEYSEEDGKDISHAWNIVKLGNSYFHVDCCWDDSTNDRTGTQYGYDNFMINDDLAKLKKYHKETNIKYPSALYNRYDNKATAICDIEIGDISGDGSILLDDYNLIKSYITHTNTVPLTDAQLRAADVNLDGKTDLTDLSYYSIYINSNPTVNFKTYLITNKTN